MHRDIRKKSCEESRSFMYGLSEDILSKGQETPMGERVKYSCSIYSILDSLKVFRCRSVRMLPGARLWLRTRTVCRRTAEA